VSSDLDVIKAIVDAFQHSNWAEIDVSSGSLRIHLSTQRQASTDAAPATRTDPRSASNEPGEGAPGVDSADGGSPPTAPVIPPGAHAVVSPSPGIFWRSPHPGAPPFADAGDDVQSGTTLGIVEVMKLMNHISSSIAGTVVGVFVGNGMRVDRGTALFAIQPSTSP
jgi:acetyl-CoA carboxylase biotin carboxyl carrier protein